MKRKILNIIGWTLVVLICICGVLLESWKQGKAHAEWVAAERLYPVLAGRDFEAVELDEAGKRIFLYCYRKKENSSARERTLVESIPIDESLIPDVRRFKGIKAVCGGVFFANDITWDGEWSGLCFYPENLDGIPADNILATDTAGVYSFNAVPKHLL